MSTVAKRYGVNSRTLGWWRSRLHCEAAKREAEPRLLPVVVRQQRDAQAGTLELVVSDFVLRVTTGTDPGYVAALAGALRGC